MFKSFITKVISVCLFIMGVLFAITITVPESDGSFDFGYILFALVLAALFMGAAVALWRWGSKGKEPNPYAYNPGPTAYQPPVGTGTPYVTPSPTPVPTVAPVVAAPAAQKASPSTAPDPLERLLSRASDLYPALKDFVRHDRTGNHDSAMSHAAATLLASGGLLDWDPTPNASMTKLSRTGKFWTSLRDDEVTTENYHRIVSVETALNVAQMLGSAGIGMDESDDAIRSKARDRILASLDAPLPAWDPMPELSLAYPGLAPQDTPGEWLERMGLSFYAENYPADVRVVFEMASNVAEGVTCVSVELPSPEVFASLADDHVERVSVARTYSLRLCLLMARMAFAACDKVRRVVVNGHLHDGTVTLLSVDVDRAALERISPAVASDAVTRGGFPQDPSISASFDTTGWFVEVVPALTLDSEPVSAVSRFEPLELDGRPCPEAMQRACGARIMSDLGINENAGRLAALNKLLPDLKGTTGDVVSRIVALRDASDGDLTVAEACERTSNALVEGTLDVTDTDQIARTFMDGSALDRAVERANEMTDVPEGEVPRLEEALALLEETLAPIEQVGAYLDDPSTVYRYFGSIAERIRFNCDIDDHARTVRLVPDSYFRAHILCARFLNSLERFDEALEHGLVVQRIAPASTDAALVVVRTLEDQSRTYEAADLLIETLKKTATARDAALCHYRLAYMEWKLGRNDLAVACYQRALRWNTDIAGQARIELDDLLESNPELKRLTDEEAVEALNAAEIPIGGSRAVSDSTLAAAITCIDNGAFRAARPLMSIEYELVRDDTLVNVYRSLIPYD